nr:hypothetical protein [uncultured Rhodopila sp.]
MNCRRIVIVTGAILGALALSACDGGAPASGQAQADAQTAAACRERADAVYDRQNRGDIYAPNSSVNSPFSANYNPDNPSRGLSQLYAHDKLVSNCIRNTGTGAERSQPPADQH